MLKVLRQESSSWVRLLTVDVAVARAVAIALVPADPLEEA